MNKFALRATLKSYPQNGPQHNFLYNKQAPLPAGKRAFYIQLVPATGWRGGPGSALAPLALRRHLSVALPFFSVIISLYQVTCNIFFRISQPFFVCLYKIFICFLKKVLEVFGPTSTTDPRQAVPVSEQNERKQ